MRRSKCVIYSVSEEVKMGCPKTGKNRGRVLDSLARLLTVRDSAKPKFFWAFLSRTHFLFVAGRPLRQSRTRLC